MTCLAAIHDRLQQTAGFPALLDTAYEAFEVMLAAIEDQQDPASGMFSQFVSAATCAADGRDAIASASSLPLRRLHPAGDAAATHGFASTAETGEIVALSAVLCRVLAHAAGAVASESDRAACHAAASRAAAVHLLLTGVPP